MTLLGISDIMLGDYRYKILKILIGRGIHIIDNVGNVGIVFLFALLFISSSYPSYGYADDREHKELEPHQLELLSPVGAITRSFLVPGWGQIYTGKRIQGTATFISIVALTTGGLVARSRFSEIYNNKYRPSAKSDPNSQVAKFYYDKANQHYKMSKGLFISAIGFWVYGIVDSYVNANIYNAKSKAEKLRKDLEKIKELELQFSFFEAGKVGEMQDSPLIINISLSF